MKHACAISNAIMLVSAKQRESIDSKFKEQSVATEGAHNQSQARTNRSQIIERVNCYLSCILLERMLRRVLELQKENELLKNKINNFISDSQEFQKKQVEERTPIVRPPASPSIPNIKVSLALHSILTTISLGPR